MMASSERCDADMRSYPQHLVRLVSQLGADNRLEPQTFATVRCARAGASDDMRSSAAGVPACPR